MIPTHAGQVAFDLAEEHVLGIAEEARQEERRAVYEYLRVEAEQMWSTRRDDKSVPPERVRAVVTRLAGEILRGYHVRPQGTNLELWR